jgi:hypothetical protein
MTTSLDRPLRREVLIDGAPYVVTLTTEGLRVVPKGHRKGVEVTWQQILAGEVTLHAQLADSLQQPEPTGGGAQEMRRPKASTRSK